MAVTMAAAEAVRPPTVDLRPLAAMAATCQGGSEHQSVRGRGVAGREGR